MRRPKIKRMTAQFTFDFPSAEIGLSRLIQADCFDWLRRVPSDTIHAVVTDPPYGVKEYDSDQLEKRANGKGGIWRIPPSFDGSNRQPLPRFTALDPTERARLRTFFLEWGRLVVNALRPGGHVFIATNAFVSQLVFGALVESGLEFRGELIRLVRTLRGGDRPKNAETEFSGVSSMAKGCYEPWGVLRKPLRPGMRVSDCLREFQTGGLRRYLNGKPFEDVILSERTPRFEREIANHPSLKPQSLMRRLVYAALPLGQGVLVDPFMGAGSTIAAANAIGVNAVGVERDESFFELARNAVPRLARLHVPTSDRLVGAHSEELLFQSSAAPASAAR
jgi:site-specific DNA-methyltransferase (adenine-specific)